MKLTCIKTTRLYLTAALIISISSIQAQNKDAENAREFLEHKNYGSALPLLLKQLEVEPNHALLNYQAGLCYLNSRSLKHKAVEYLEKALEYSPSWKAGATPGTEEAPFHTHKLLGDAYTYAYKFEPAISSYEKYKELMKDKGEKADLEEADLKIELCRHLKHYRPSQAIAVNPKTGRPCSELVKGRIEGKLNKDRSAMVYTLQVPVDRLQKQDHSSRYYEDPELPANWQDSVDNFLTTRRPSKKHIEKDTVIYAATVGTSYDGQVVLTYKNDDGDGNLYITRLHDNTWSQPLKMKKSANPAGWEPFESLSADGKYLYFASDRIGGFGGMDIYRCRMQPNGEWSKAVNLGPSINSVADETAPFIHPDGVTLLFSSNRLKPGSYDIYASTAGVASNWEKPVNVGFPINRNENDIFQVNADNKIYSSSKKAGDKKDGTDTLNRKKNTGEFFLPGRDNYLITFTGKQKAPLNLRRGTVTDAQGKEPVAADVTVIDNETGEVNAYYQTSEKSGAFSFILPAGKNLQIVYNHKGYLPQSEHIDLKDETARFEEYSAQALMPLVAGSTATLNNVFFAENSAAIDSASKIEIARIVKLMNENPRMKVELKNTIYSADQRSRYKRLSKARVKAVEKALTEEGVHKKRIETKGQRKKLETEKEKKDKTTRIKKRIIEEKEVKPVQVLVLKISENKEY